MNGLQKESKKRKTAEPNILQWTFFFFLSDSTDIFLGHSKKVPKRSTRPRHDDIGRRI